MTRTTSQGLLVHEGGDPATVIAAGVPTADSVDAAIARYGDRIGEAKAARDDALTAAQQAEDAAAQAVINIASQAQDLDVDGAIAHVVSTATQALDAAEALQVEKVSVTVAEGRYRRVLSELRGVDPAADATPTINAALAQASGTGAAELVLPEGEFRAFTGGLINVPNVTVRGAGRDKTRLRLDGNFDGIKVAGTKAQPLANVAIEDLTISGTAAALGNQRGIFLQWAPGFRLRRVRLTDAGNNNLNVFQCDGGLVEDVEVSGARDFGALIFKSRHVRVIDFHAHHIGVAGRANQGLQFKNCRGVWAIRPRIHNIQGYGLMTRRDVNELGPLDEATPADEDNGFFDVDVRDILAGGTFSPTGLYLESTTRAMVRGGIFDTSAGGLISIASSPRARLSDLGSLRRAVGAAVSLSGTDTTLYRIHNVHVEACQQGFVFSGVGAGSLRDSSAVNGTGTGSSFNAGCRVINGTQGLQVTGSDFSDYQSVKTQKRGIQEELGSGATGRNRFENNTAYGNTGADITVLTGGNPASLSRNNGTTAAPLG